MKNWLNEVVSTSEVVKVGHKAKEICQKASVVDVGKNKRYCSHPKDTTTTTGKGVLITIEEEVSFL